MPDSPRFTGSGPYGNDPLLQIHITPMEAHHLPRPDSGVQHYPNSRSAVTKFRSFHHRPKASYLFRSQNGNRPFTKRRRVHTGDRIFPAPSAPQGKGQNAAHHRPALVTLPVGCKSSLQKMGTMLRRQLPDRKTFQFRTPPHQSSGEIPDIAQRRRAKITLRLQHFFHGGGKGNRPFPFPQFLSTQKNCLSGPAHAAAASAQAQQLYCEAGSIQHIQSATFQ